MKFKINRDHFVNGLQKVQNIVGSRTSMPILNTVLIKAESDHISLTTFNLDVGISCQIQASIQEMGMITLPVRKLVSIVKSLPSLEVEVDVSASNQAKIASGGSFFRIMGMNQEEFPPLPSFPDKQGLTIPQDTLLKMIKSVSYAQSVDENRYILNGIYFLAHENELTLVATDGRRLSVITQDLPEKITESFSFILPAKTANELERLLSQEEQIRISFNGRQVAFHVSYAKNQESSGQIGSLYLVSKIVEGNYPNYQQVIPKMTAHRIKLDRELLLESISRAAIVTSEKNNSVKIKIANNRLEIFSSSPDLGESHESMAIAHEGPHVELAFNPQFLIDPLRAVVKDEIFFEFTDELSPGLLKTMDKFQCVIMPLRLG